MVIPHKSLDAFALRCRSGLRPTPTTRRPAPPTWAWPQPSRRSSGIETSLARAFDGMPHLELPFGGGENGKRTPHLRAADLREPQREGGEEEDRDVQHRQKSPSSAAPGCSRCSSAKRWPGRAANLTYMLVYEDMAAHDKQWSAFARRSRVEEAVTTPGFTDPEIVSNISNMYLRPTAYSQI